MQFCGSVLKWSFGLHYAYQKLMFIAHSNWSNVLFKLFCLPQHIIVHYAYYSNDFSQLWWMLEWMLYHSTKQQCNITAIELHLSFIHLFRCSEGVVVRSINWMHCCMIWNTSERIEFGHQSSQCFHFPFKNFNFRSITLIRKVNLHCSKSMNHKYFGQVKMEENMLKNYQKMKKKSKNRLLTNRGKNNG